MAVPNESNSELGPAAHPSFAERLSASGSSSGSSASAGRRGRSPSCRRELVEKRRWISQARFLHALNFCMLLPGPEATAAGHLHRLASPSHLGRHRGRARFLCFPRSFILWTLSFVYAAYGNVPWIAAIFYGLKPAVMAIVAVAVIRIGRKALKNEVMWTIAALAFVAIFFLKAPFPLIILAAGHDRVSRRQILEIEIQRAHAATRRPETPSVLDDETESPAHTRPSWSRAIKVAVIWLALWFAPIIAIGLSLGTESHSFPRRPFLQQGGRGHFRRRLRGSALRRATSAFPLRLAAARANDGRTGSG